MKTEFDLPIWRRLEDIYEHYLDETPSSDVPAGVSDHQSLTWPARYAIAYASRYLAVDEAVLQEDVQAGQLTEEKRVQAFQKIQQEKDRIEALRAMVRNAMVQDAVKGEWIAIGRPKGKRKHQLIPPGNWSLMDFDIEKEEAGREQLGYDELRCAFTRDIPHSHQLYQEIQKALGQPHVIRNGIGGRPSNMRLLERESKRRIESGEILPTLAAEANALRTWFVATHPTLMLPNAHTIENGIRADYREAKRLATESPTKP